MIGKAVQHQMGTSVCRRARQPQFVDDFDRVREVLLTRAGLPSCEAERSQPKVRGNYRFDLCLSHDVVIGVTS